MTGMPISNEYEIRQLSPSFYSFYPASLYPEVLRKKGRPYDVIVFESKDDYYVCVPFRTRLKHNRGFHFFSKPLINGDNPGLDYSKMLIIKDGKYIGNAVLIDSLQMACFNANIAQIQRGIFDYLEGYINHMKGTNILHTREFNRRYQYTTLKYFHLELGIN